MTSIAQRLASVVGSDWKKDDQYYDGADEWVGVFWDNAESNRFRHLFNKMNPARIIDLACGRGRHSWQMKDWPNEKTLVDITEENVEFCKKRFADVKNVHILQNNGVDLSELSSASYTAIFSYDSMVHFDHIVVFEYLQEAYRVLEGGGMALFHHSNYGANPGGDYRGNPSWRNFMPSGLFFDYATKCGFSVVEQVIFSWGDHLATDAVTLLKKN